MSIISEVNATLADNRRIARDEVLDWIKNASDLGSLAKLYQLTDEAYDRIHPDLGRDASCGLILTYLLECIRQSTASSWNDEDILGRYEAATTLHGWFCQLLDGGDVDVLNSISERVTKLFLDSGEDVRNAIEMGFLEHVLETAAARPHFEHWSSNPVLQPAWQRALEWGKAHPDQMWGMLKELRHLEEQE